MYYLMLFLLFPRRKVAAFANTNYAKAQTCLLDEKSLSWPVTMFQVLLFSGDK
jgi:hypothetical protein